MALAESAAGTMKIRARLRRALKWRHCYSSKLPPRGLSNQTSFKDLFGKTRVRMLAWMLAVKRQNSHAFLAHMGENELLMGKSRE